MQAILFSSTQTMSSTPSNLKSTQGQLKGHYPPYTSQSTWGERVYSRAEGKRFGDGNQLLAIVGRWFCKRGSVNGYEEALRTQLFSYTISYSFQMTTADYLWSLEPPDRPVPLALPPPTESTIQTTSDGSIPVAPPGQMPTPSTSHCR